MTKKYIFQIKAWKIFCFEIILWSHRVFVFFLSFILFCFSNNMQSILSSLALRNLCELIFPLKFSKILFKKKTNWITISAWTWERASLTRKQNKKTMNAIFSPGVEQYTFIARKNHVKKFLRLFHFSLPCWVSIEMIFHLIFLFVVVLLFR